MPIWICLSHSSLINICLSHSSLISTCLPQLAVSWPIALPNMNTAEVQTLREALTALGGLMGGRDQRIKELTEQLSASTFMVQPPTTVKLEKHDSKPSRCRRFLLQCQRYFAKLGSLTDKKKVAQTISLLTGWALTWATAVWKKVARMSLILTVFSSYFQGSLIMHRKEEILLAMKQGLPQAAEYVLDFRTLTAEVDWSKLALLAFRPQLQNPCSSKHPRFHLLSACSGERTDSVSTADTHSTVQPSPLTLLPEWVRTRLFQSRTLH